MLTQKKIYTQDAHALRLENVDKDALYVLEKLTAAGHTAYLVGGGVRDLLLQKKPKDYDISTSAEPETIRKLFRNCILIGRRFRLAHIRFGKKIIEVSTFRSGDTDDDTLITRDNQWGTPEEDVLRRDFTINGLFYDASEQTIIDYVNGVEDLTIGHLRTIGQPFVRFRQDPVRMLRLLKFRARFSFSIDSHTESALIENKQEILKSSSARVLEELLRMWESGFSKSFLHLLATYGFLPLILPAVADFLETEEGEEIYALLTVCDSLAEQKQVVDRALPIACLLFPMLAYRIRVLFTDKASPPHLGKIQEEATALFRESFDTFLRVPHRLQIAVVSILTSQFRLTPLDVRKQKTLIIPKDPCFTLALQFFQFRVTLCPGFAPLLRRWEEKFATTTPEEEEIANPKPRRRRRRSPPSSS